MLGGLKIVRDVLESRVVDCFDCRADKFGSGLEVIGEKGSVKEARRKDLRFKETKTQLWNQDGG
jgi:hypothetical protein